jgi:hypothetical protein
LFIFSPLPAAMRFCLALMFAYSPGFFIMVCQPNEGGGFYNEIIYPKADSLRLGMLAPQWMARLRSQGVGVRRFDYHRRRTARHCPPNG